MVGGSSRGEWGEWNQLTCIAYPRVKPKLYCSLLGIGVLKKLKFSMFSYLQPSQIEHNRVRPLFIGVCSPRLRPHSIVQWMLPIFSKKKRSISLIELPSFEKKRKEFRTAQPELTFYRDYLYTVGRKVGNTNLDMQLQLWGAVVVNIVPITKSKMKQCREFFPLFNESCFDINKI